MQTYSFPLMQTARAGFADLRRHWAFIQIIVAVPIILGFVTLMIIDGFNFIEKPLLVAVLKIPEDFIRGIFLALFVRYSLMQETPEQSVASRDTQILILQSTLIFTALNFIFSGIMGGVSQIVLVTKSETQVPLENLVMSLIGLGAILALFRFQWVPITTAAGMAPVNFARQMGGGFLLSLRIFLLWTFITVPSLFIMALASEIIALVTHSENLQQLSGPPMWFLLLLSVALGMFTAIVQTAASIHAIKYCMKGKA